MTQPLVCCVCLTKDRPEMLQRAVRSFRAQTYPRKRLLIVNSGGDLDQFSNNDFQNVDPGGVVVLHRPELAGMSIGAVRNFANKVASSLTTAFGPTIGQSAMRTRASHQLPGVSLNFHVAEVIAHWDDDDWSHPERLSEQVALLQTSGAAVFGYSDMLFWRNPGVCDCDPGPCVGPRCGLRGEAWLYTGPQKALGTSLCYWRQVWQQKPFPDQPRPGHANGEDTDWIRNLNLASISSLGNGICDMPCTDPSRRGDPMMIASIHGGNTSGSYKRLEDSPSWRRVPNWDDYCRRAMSLQAGENDSRNPTRETGADEVDATGNRPRSQDEQHQSEH